MGGYSDQLPVSSSNASIGALDGVVFSKNVEDARREVGHELYQGP